MSRRPDRFDAELETVVWPTARLDDALSAVASHCGLRAESMTAESTAAVSEETLDDWVQAMAERAGLTGDRVFADLDELESLLRHGAPMLLRLSASTDGAFVALVGKGPRSVLALGPDGHRRWLSIASLCDAVRRPFEAPLAAGIEITLERLALGRRRHRRARAALTRDRLATNRFRGCWLLRLPPGTHVRKEASDARVAPRLTMLAAAYLAQYLLFVGSWWLLGQAVLNGSVNQGWLLGWLLLLISLIPLRLVVTWQQGFLTVSIGAWLRRRLLRGAFHVARQDIKRQGVGQLFSMVVEAAALDTLALTGGLAAAFAVIEIAGALLVLWWGASRWPLVALGGCLVFACCAGWSYYRRRLAWTNQRLAMSHELLESMMGHRTRLAQQPPEQRHLREDQSLDEAVVLGRKMDATGLWLVAALPRVWMATALAALLPSLAAGVATTKVAISIGGIILALRGLQHLAGGIVSLMGAIVAGQSVAPLARVAASDPLPLVPFSVSRGRASGNDREPVLQARDVVFRYDGQHEAVLTGATLHIEPGARYLLEGPSGSGKTTFATLVAGLEEPESGLLLAGGLDRSALGQRGWGKRIVMAPQIHDNHLMGGTLAFNLLMGRRWPAEAQDLRDAEAMCRELGLGELLDRLPGGLDQMVGETGWQLSQGERVRVFLARALLQQPDLLVLDESFSALDPENLDRAVRAVAARDTAVLAIAHL